MGGQKWDARIAAMTPPAQVRADLSRIADAALHGREIIRKLADENELKGVIDQADFNDEGKLGSGKETRWPSGIIATSSGLATTSVSVRSTCKAAASLSASRSRAIFVEGTGP